MGKSSETSIPRQQLGDKATAVHESIKSDGGEHDDRDDVFITYPTQNGKIIAFFYRGTDQLALISTEQLVKEGSATIRRGTTVCFTSNGEVTSARLYEGMFDYDALSNQKSLQKTLEAMDTARDARAEYVQDRRTNAS